MPASHPQEKSLVEEISTSASNSSREVRLSIRTNREQKEILKRAALSRSTDLSQFVLEASLREARRVMADESVLVLSAQDYEQLYRAMDEASSPNQNLQRLLLQKRVWDE